LLLTSNPLSRTPEFYFKVIISITTQLLEIKCPFKSSMSLAEVLRHPNGEIKRLGDGQYLILPKERMDTTSR